MRKEASASFFYGVSITLLRRLRILIIYILPIRMYNVLHILKKRFL